MFRVFNANVTGMTRAARKLRGLMSALWLQAVRVVLALSVACLAIIPSQSLVGQREPRDTSAKLSLPATDMAVGEAEEAERSVDSCLGGASVKVTLLGHDQTTLCPAHTTSFWRDRRALLLTVRLRC